MAEYVCITDGWSSKLTDERIVRCKDCKHYTEDEAEYYHYCGLWWDQVEPNGFCKWGEPREGA